MQHDDGIDLRLLFLIIRRQFILIVAITGIFLAAACVYVSAVPEEFTARTLLYLDKKTTNKLSDLQAANPTILDSSAVESEVEVILSGRVTEQVIKRLQARGYFAGLQQNTPEYADMVRTLSGNLGVSRVGETYVLSIQYTSTSPKEAADIANAYAEAYIIDQLNSLSEVSNRTGDWLTTKIKELREQSLDAVRKVSEYRSEYNSKIRNLNTNGDTAAQGKLNDTSLSELRSLEKESVTYTNLYDSYLEKYKTLATQESFPVTETRVITAATPPVDKSHPKTMLLLGASLIFGSGLGLLIALIRDNLDKTLRRAGQASREVGTSFIGFIPKISQRKLEKIELSSIKEGNSAALTITPEKEGPKPSIAWETVRVLRYATDDRSGMPPKKVIGILSQYSDHSKGVIAATLAQFIAQNASCILIDADVKNSGFKKALGDNGTSLGGVLSGSTPLENCLFVSPNGRLAVLPWNEEDAVNAQSYLTAERIAALIIECKKRYDYVIINLPPLSDKADFYGFSKVIDAYAIVAEWGKTLSNSLNFYLEQNRIERDKIIGVLLSNADMKRMEKFYGHRKIS